MSIRWPWSADRKVKVLSAPIGLTAYDIPVGEVGQELVLTVEGEFLWIDPADRKRHEGDYWVEDGRWRMLLRGEMWTLEGGKLVADSEPLSDRKIEARLRGLRGVG